MNLTLVKKDWPAGWGQLLLSQLLPSEQHPLLQQSHGNPFTSQQFSGSDTGTVTFPSQTSVSSAGVGVPQEPVFEHSALGHSETFFPIQIPYPKLLFKYHTRRTGRKRLSLDL